MLFHIGLLKELLFLELCDMLCRLGSFHGVTIFFLNIFCVQQPEESAPIYVWHKQQCWNNCMVLSIHEDEVDNLRLLSGSLADRKPRCDNFQHLSD